MANMCCFARHGYSNSFFSEGEGGEWDDSLPFRREDFVRVVASCLQGLGYT